MPTNNVPKIKVKLNPNYQAILNLTQALKDGLKGCVGFERSIQLRNINGVLFNSLELIEYQETKYTQQGYRLTISSLDYNHFDEDEDEDLAKNECQISRFGKDLELLVACVFKCLDKVTQCKGCGRINYEPHCLDCLLNAVVIQSLPPNLKFSCSICCLEQIQHEKIILKCGHQLCQTCKTQISNCLCPICRAPFY